MVGAADRPPLPADARHQADLGRRSHQPTGRRARSWSQRVSNTFPVKTAIGEITGHAYQTRFDEVQHFAFVHGRIGDGLRHADAPASGSMSWQRRARRRDDLDQQDPRSASRPRVSGILVYLRDGTAGVPVTAALAAPSSADELPARSSGARWAWGPRSCAISVCARSSCWPRSRPHLCGPVGFRDRDSCRAKTSTAEPGLALQARIHLLEEIATPRPAPTL